jgi:DNA-binding CsgD family transcriptional regulator
MTISSTKAKQHKLPMNQEEFDEKLETLTNQQKKVLQLFLAGNDEQAIADNLSLVEGTVRSHFSGIYSKFGLNNENCSGGLRLELAALCFEFKPEWVALSIRDELGCPELEEPSGLVPLDSYLYISRYDSQNNNIEKDCYREILKPGALIRIKSSRYMGKTSLIFRILNKVQEQEEIRVVKVNLAEAERELFESLERFLRWFCFIVGRRLKLDNQLDNYWDTSSGGYIDNCINYFEQYLLPEINCPIILVLDEVDRVFPYKEVTRTFCSLLRLMHESAKTQTDNPIFRNLRLIIAHSTDVYVQLKTTESPFNVGIPIELSDFTPEQIKTLAIRHGLGTDYSQVNDLMAMVGGHPYLVSLALYHLAERHMGFEQLLREAPTRAGIYSAHLRFLESKLRCNPILRDAYINVVTATDWIELETMENRLLESLGLVEKYDNLVRSRCELYRLYFSHVLCMNTNIQ